MSSSIANVKLDLAIFIYYNSHRSVTKICIFLVTGPGLTKTPFKGSGKNTLCKGKNQRINLEKQADIDFKL